MSFDLNHEEHLRELQKRLHRARMITPDLMAKVIAQVCPRLQAQRRASKARIIDLVESGACADAALALLESELPQWKLRRLIYEDGEWHCALSKHVGLPAELDDMAEGNHESLPLAILSAFLVARDQSFTAAETRRNPVPLVGLPHGYAVCCDNFA